MKDYSLTMMASGGIQQEAIAPSVRKRVLVICFCSERQEAFEAGFSKLVETQINSILAIMYESFKEKEKLPHVSPFGVAQPL